MFHYIIHNLPKTIEQLEWPIPEGGTMCSSQILPGHTIQINPSTIFLG